LVLKEIFKNSADHTQDDASFGMDILTADDGEVFQIVFSFCDMGDGLYKNVGDWLEKNDEILNSNTLAVAAIYHKALKKGFSSKEGNGTNFGLGLSLILEAVRSLKMELSIFDGESRCVISRMTAKMNDREIRDCIYDLGKRRGFFLTGKVNV
jgi:hypothetical protein